MAKGPGTTGRRCGARAGRRRPIIKRAQIQGEMLRPWKRPMRPWRGPWDNREKPDSGINLVNEAGAARWT
eukprot:scaffold226335_cov16-Attheya_sp.AAC.1